LTVLSHWLTITGFLFLWYRSRKREGRSFFDPRFTPSGPLALEIAFDHHIDVVIAPLETAPAGDEADVAGEGARRRPGRAAL
jgi:hypothetical protein